MIKTKGTDVGKVGGNHPAGGMITGTEKLRVGGQMPATQPLPTMADQQPWLTVGGDAKMPQTQETGTLPLFSQVGGNTDTGVGHSGDLGGAA